MDELERLILARRLGIPAARALLAGVTGIDGSGKGYVTARLADRLRGQGINVAAIGIDGWLNLPAVRFDPANPAGHFYRHALRFDELFAQLVLPLRDRRTLRLEADHAEETAVAYRKHVYDFADVDVILLEGIFLLKREHRGHFDLSVWLDCTFETALERALSRGQEGLPPAETVRAYETIYFPAQRIHLAGDDPRAAASRVIPNDPRLQARTTGPASVAG
jgi:uridine kinase